MHTTADIGNADGQLMDAATAQATGCSDGHTLMSELLSEVRSLKAKQSEMDGRLSGMRQ